EKSLVPAVEVRPERLALLAHHAEAVAAGGFHHPPALAELDLLRAELFQARDFGFDVVRLDVQVDAAVVADLLQQQDRLVIAGFQHGVTAVAVLVCTGDRLAERLAPELDVGGEVVDLAVEDEGGQAAAVGHAAFLRWMGPRDWAVFQGASPRRATARRSGPRRARDASCARCRSAGRWAPP